MADYVRGPEATREAPPRANVVYALRDAGIPERPVGFGDPHLAPGAPVSPVFAQNPGVFAALTVDAQGQMNVVWLDVNQASPGWQDR